MDFLKLSTTEVLWVSVLLLCPGFALESKTVQVTCDLTESGLCGEGQLLLWLFCARFLELELQLKPVDGSSVKKNPVLSISTNFDAFFKARLVVRLASVVRLCPVLI